MTPSNPLVGSGRRDGAGEAQKQAVSADSCFNFSETHTEDNDKMVDSEADSNNKRHTLVCISLHSSAETEPESTFFPSYLKYLLQGEKGPS